MIAVLLATIPVRAFGGAPDARAAGPVLTVAVPGHFPPEYLLKEGAAPRGFAIELMNALASRAGYALRFVVFETWSGALAALERGEADVIPSVALTPERGRFLWFTRPVEKLGVRLFVRTGAGRLEGGVAALAGRRVSVVRGSSGADLLQAFPELRPVVHESRYEALLALLRGETDAAIDSRDAFLATADEAGLGGRLRTAGGPLMEIVRAVGVSRRRPEVFERLEAAVSDVLGSPEYRNAYARWHGRAPGASSNDLLVLVLGLSLALSTAFLLYWRHRSLVKVNERLRALAAARSESRRESDAARALAESIVEVAPVPLIVFDEGLACATFNNAALDVFGARARTGAYLYSVLGPRSEDFLGEALAALVERGVSFDRISCRCPRRAGRSRAMLAYGRVAGGGEGGRYLLVCEDVTEREQLEELQSLIDAMPDATLFVDEGGRIVRANRQAADLFGLGPGELGGLGVETLIPEAAREAHVRHRRRYRAQPVVRPMGTGLPLRAMRADGTPFPVDVNLSPVRFQGQSLVAAAIRDITVHKESEAALERAREEADRANLTKTRFLAAAGHDLRQPLQSLSMYLGILQRAPEQLYAGGVADKMARSLEVMRDLLDALLDISLLDSGSITPRIEAFAIGPLIERTLEAIGPVAVAQGVDLRVVASAVRVRSDPRLLERIVANFLSNAVKFSHRGRVLIGCRRRRGRLSVQVWDEGPGIPEEALDTIFEEYVQLENPARVRDEGLGLGLAVVKRLADLLGHHVEVRSVLGQGSMFEVTLPIADESGARSHEHSEPSRGAARTVAKAEQRGYLLLVDDDLAVLDSTAILLETCGYEVGRAADAEAAVRDCRRRVPSALIVDFRLPGDGNGLELVRRLRETAGRMLPAVIVTGDAGAARPDSDLPRACRILRKPIDVDQLLTVLGALDAERSPGLAGPERC